MPGSTETMSAESPIMMIVGVVDLSHCPPKQGVAYEFFTWDTTSLQLKSRKDDLFEEAMRRLFTSPPDNQ